MTPLEINTRIATDIMGEAKPTWFPPWEESFHYCMNGEPTRSARHNWYIAHLYENSDVQEWMPVNFWEDAREVERLIYHMTDIKSYYFQVNSVRRHFEARFTSNRTGRTSCSSKILTEAICLAAIATIDTPGDS